MRYRSESNFMERVACIPTNILPMTITTYEQIHSAFISIYILPSKAHL